MDELQIRETAITKARKKYIPSRTKNISEALALYLEHDAEKENQILLFISKKTKPKNIIDKLGRPDCPKCGGPLGLRVINTPTGKANIHGWKTCWECLRCGYEKYNAETVKELINKELSVNGGRESG